MLVITRRVNEAIVIGPDIVIKVNDILVHRPKGIRVLLGITAPREIVIVREELRGRKQREGAGQ